MAVAHPPPRPAQRLGPEAVAAGAPIVAGRYRLDRRLGVGSSATVYAATDLRLQRPVSVKLFHRAVVADPSSRARFEQQATKAARLRHPHIAAVLDAGFAEDERRGDRPFVVTEPVGPTSLRDILDREGRLPVERTLVLTRQLAAALAHAHRRGIVHADVKPENVLVDGAGARAKLVDFSLSFVSARTGVVTSETLARRAAYVSPEQVLGRPVSPASDVYGLGVLVYEMIVGRPPFVGDNPVATAGRRLNERARPAGLFEPTIPVELEKVLGRALESEPEDRWPTVEQFDEALCRVDQDCRPTMPADEPSDGPTAPPARRRSSGWQVPGAWVVPIPALVLALALASSLFGPLVERLSGFNLGIRLGGPTVPDVVGMAPEEAEVLARKRGLAFAVVGSRASDRYPSGVIIQQTPIAGWRPAEDQPLRVTVSAGVTVPDLRGKPLSEAMATLAELGWKAGRVDRAPQPGAPSSAVLIQHPRPGEVVPRPGELALVVAE